MKFGKSKAIGQAELDASGVKRLHHEMQQAAIRDIVPTLALVLVAVLVIYYALNSHISTIWFDVWAIVTAAVQVPRYIVLRLCMNKPMTRGRVNAVLYSQVIGGLCWAALLLFWRNDMATSLQLLFVLAPIGVCLGSVTSAGAWPSFSLAVIGSAKLPFFLWAAVIQAEGLLILTVPMAVFVLLDVALLRNYHRRLKESFELRIRNQSLIDDLTAKNVNLERAQREALQAADAKSDFLARMSHELRTPINGVIGSADMLTRTTLDGSQRRWLETIRGSGDDMLSMVNQLLDHSRINDNELVLNEHTFDIKQSIGGCIEAQLSNHPDAQIELSVDESVPPLMIADSFRINQVLDHVINNARKFSHNGKVDVAVDVVTDIDAEAGDSEFLRIAVSDTGIGIPEDKLDSIFSDLEQLDGSMSRRFGGSGLGLTLSRQFVALMQGQLTVQSQEGAGSTFSVVLPLRVPDAETGVSYEDAALVGLKILIAEDNPVNQLVLESMLEELGCEVSLADDGVEALAAMNDASFDMVFMDCQMPEMDGLQATSAAREQGFEAPIVAVTANALTGDRERCIASGMNDYVTKPVTRDTIAGILKRYTGDDESPMAASA